MKWKLYVLIFLMMVPVSFLRADEQPSDPIGENLFPPELVMQNQQAIGLNDEQKTFIRTELQEAQSKFMDLQWKLQDEVEKMASMLKQERIDEEAVLTQLDKVLNHEREIKRTQFTLVVRIKNDLTPEQRTKLQEMKKKLPAK